MTTFGVYRDDGIHIGYLDVAGVGGLAKAVGGLGPYQVVAVDDFQSPTRVFVKVLTPSPKQ